MGSASPPRSVTPADALLGREREHHKSGNPLSDKMGSVHPWVTVLPLPTEVREARILRKRIAGELETDIRELAEGLNALRAQPQPPRLP